MERGVRWVEFRTSFFDVQVDVSSVMSVVSVELPIAPSNLKGRLFISLPFDLEQRRDFGIEDEAVECGTGRKVFPEIGVSWLTCWASLSPRFGPPGETESDMLSEMSGTSITCRSSLLSRRWPSKMLD
jgi:hypothetical protein